MAHPDMPPLRHPIKVSAALAAGLAIFSLASFNLMTFPRGIRINPADFLAMVLAYPSFLAWLGVGITLAFRSRLIRWWLLTWPLPLMGSMVFYALVLRLASQIDPGSSMTLIGSIGRMMFWVIVTWLGLGCTVAGWGWVGYVRWCCSRGSA